MLFSMPKNPVKKMTKKLSPRSTKKTSQKETSSTTSPKVSNLAIFDQGQIVFEGVNTHNLKNIDLILPKNKLIVITGVSGSGKSSLAFDTIYKEGQFRYIESLSSYLRQFFNLGDRPDILHCEGLSPAIAIEQNKKWGSSRSTVWTLTEIDDYLRLLFAKLGDSYCYSCGDKIVPQTIEQIIEQLHEQYLWKKIFLLKEAGEYKDKDNLKKFLRKNRNKVDKGEWFTRYLLVTENKSLDPIEFFYLEEPNIDEKFLPLTIYGIYDRVTVEKDKLERLKEDCIKILAETSKFGVYVEENRSPLDPLLQGGAESWKSPLEKEELEVPPCEGGYPSEAREGGNVSDIHRFTDKMYCPKCNIEYPEFTTQHFSPNRQEWACPHCHGIGEILQADFDKVIDPHSGYMNAILPWRDSPFGQSILQKLAEKYSIDADKIRWELPTWFTHVVVEGDNELLRVKVWGKRNSIKYQGIENILKEQYIKGLLTVDFQAMMNMKACPDCNGAKLRKESLNVFIQIDNNPKNRPPLDPLLTGGAEAWSIKEIKPPLLGEVPAEQGERFFTKEGKYEVSKYNIADFQSQSLAELGKKLEKYRETSTKDTLLIQRITTPLLDRLNTIVELGLGYLNLHRIITTLSWWEIQRLRLTKQLGNKLTGIMYILDEPTIGLDDREIEKVIKSIRELQQMGNTIVVVEHNDRFIKNADRIVEIWPRAGDFGGEVMYNGPYNEFLKTNTLTAQYMTNKKIIDINFDHTPTNETIKIRKAKKFNLNNIDVDIRLWSFTVITGSSWAGKTTLMYETLYKFLNDKQRFIQSYIRLQLLKKGMSWEEIISAPIMKKDVYEHYENLATQEFYEEIWVESIRWIDEVKNTIYVDQTSIGKTPRSCPSTFIGTFDKIRQLFAGTTQAKYLWFNTWHFSFNSNKGACPACKGYGYKKIELQFLPDTYVDCDLCKGKRYKPEILEIKRNGKNISEILDMYVVDALEFFKDIWHIKEELELMNDIGLGYIKMGQPAHTLSWGESQRLKLVKHLLKDYRWHTVYFLDEPTVGLHPDDIEKLLLVLRRFLANGDTILMIEHDQNILKFADDIIKLENGKIINVGEI